MMKGRQAMNGLFIPMLTVVLATSFIAAVPASGASEAVLHSFSGGVDDGAAPYAGLTYLGGTLYGTTSSGGPIEAGCASTCGTVFSVTPAGVEKVVYFFQGSSGSESDGGSPKSGLIDVGGTLYGTTYIGGVDAYATLGYGTVFSVTPNGTERVLHAFYGGYADGSYPSANLVNVGGVLYGTTQQGGGSSNCGAGVGCGMVFATTRTGIEGVVSVFRGGAGYGGSSASPSSSLIDIDGTLYGTTPYGGSICGTSSLGCGAVFTVTPAGDEKDIYYFKGGSDGAYPSASLINVGGTLYGTTFGGGAHGYGTVFSVTETGAETVVYSFKGDSDGADPSAALVDVNGKLYGTTDYGGRKSATCPIGCGTVFSVTKKGVEKVVYSFQGGTDGALPFASLIGVGATLYGTTWEGGGTGCGGNGCGTVFSVTP
jgi:uncharacterized repeat protein (TIGR03803 family)